MTAPSPDALLHLASLHILSTAGFPSTSRAASLTLSSIAAKYLRTVAQACTEQAALAGRTKVGASDVFEVLEEMGQGVEELEGWWTSKDGEKEVSFVGGLEALGEQLRQGVELPDALAELRLVPNLERPEDLDESGLATPDNLESPDESMEVDEEYGAATNGESSRPPMYAYAPPKSPDFSWLPPLPSLSRTDPSDLHLQLPDPNLPLDPAAPAPAVPGAPIPKLSLMDKYSAPRPYATSSLATSNFIEPPPHPAPAPVITPTSSFPALLETYNAIAGEPSAYLPPNQYRAMALDILRRSIAPPEMFGVSDTLSGHLPAPGGLILTASASDTLESPPVQVNSNPTGILARLAREMRSPYLPPTLRDRLTTIRPPQALHDADGKPVYYGEPVRGPDPAALNKARGKAPGPGEAKDEEKFYRYTWDAGPRGQEKWGKAKLPSGSRVKLSMEGEEAPRSTPDGPKKLAPLAIKLRVDKSPGIPPTPGTERGGMDWQAAGMASGSAPETETRLAPSIKLRVDKSPVAASPVGSASQPIVLRREQPSPSGLQSPLPSSAASASQTTIIPSASDGTTSAPPGVDTIPRPGIKISLKGANGSASSATPKDHSSSRRGSAMNGQSDAAPTPPISSAANATPGSVGQLANGGAGTPGQEGPSLTAVGGKIKLRFGVKKDA